MWILLSLLPFASAQECEDRFPNLIKSHNLTVCGELEASNFSAEGRLATLGDANLYSYSAGYDLPDANWSLTIGGALTTENGSVARGIRVGDADASSILGTLSYDDFRQHNKNIEARCEEAQTMSQGLVAFEDNATATFDGFATLTLEGSGNQSIFTIDSDTLNDSRLVLIDAGKHVLIRVTGDTVNWGNGSMVSTTTETKRILWVMDEASEVNLYSADWIGSLLATNASTINVSDVTFTGQMVVGDGDATANITSAWLDRARLRTNFELCDDDVSYVADFENAEADCNESCSSVGLTCDAEATDALAGDHELCADALNEVLGEDDVAQDFCSLLEIEDDVSFTDREDCYDYLGDEFADSPPELEALLSSGCIADLGSLGLYFNGLDVGGCDARGSITYQGTRVCACSDADASVE